MAETLDFSNETIQLWIIVVFVGAMLGMVIGLIGELIMHDSRKLFFDVSGILVSTTPTLILLLMILCRLTLNQ
ncbi:hypothetical protein J6TS7_20980 [Paenibacillus dendritiformis]|nr:hypothetical protein J6TS7_20980 [Paenibacillus dendritiformis]